MPANFIQARGKVFFGEERLTSLVGYGGRAYGELCNFLRGKRRRGVGGIQKGVCGGLRGFITKDVYTKNVITKDVTSASLFPLVPDEILKSQKSEFLTGCRSARVTSG